MRHTVCREKSQIMRKRVSLLQSASLRFIIRGSDVEGFASDGLPLHSALRRVQQAAAQSTQSMPKEQTLVSDSVR